MPELDRFYREAGDKATLLAVAPAQNEAGMRDRIMAGRYSFPVMLDEGSVAGQYGVRYVPALFVIDSDGNLAKTVMGAVDFDQLNKLVDDLG